jgi:hypothetical protein
MAINIPTDKETDKILAWLARRFKLSKAEIVRSLIKERYREIRSGFEFGSLGDEQPANLGDIQKELKSLDNDHDLG